METTELLRAIKKELSVSLHRRTLYQWVRRGALPKPRKKGGRLLWPEEALPLLRGLVGGNPNPGPSLGLLPQLEERVLAQERRVSALEGRARMLEERDILYAERDRLLSERDTALETAATLRTERDGLLAERAQLIAAVSRCQEESEGRAAASNLLEEELSVHRTRVAELTKKERSLRSELKDFSEAGLRKDQLCVQLSADAKKSEEEQLLLREEVARLSEALRRVLEDSSTVAASVSILASPAAPVPSSPAPARKATSEEKLLLHYLSAWVFGSVVREAPVAKWQPHQAAIPLPVVEGVLASYKVSASVAGGEVRLDTAPKDAEAAKEARGPFGLARKLPL